MPTTPVILCVEDESEVRDAIIRDLGPFASAFQIEAAADVEEAEALVDELLQDRVPLALILCDHRLPGKNGVDFLVELENKGSESPVRKVLVTGQAGHQDTIRAINSGGLNHYIAKPWRPEDLQKVVRDELTQFVLDAGLPPLAYTAILDAGPLLERVAQQGGE